MGSPRAACGVTPQGAMRVARQSRFHRILGEVTLSRKGSLPQGTAGPALPDGQCRPLGG